MAAGPACRWRCASKRMTPAATAALSDSTGARIGIRSGRRRGPATSSGRPRALAADEHQHGAGRSISYRLGPAAGCRGDDAAAAAPGPRGTPAPASAPAATGSRRALPIEPRRAFQPSGSAEPPSRSRPSRRRPPPPAGWRRHCQGPARRDARRPARAAAPDRARASTACRAARATMPVGRPTGLAASIAASDARYTRRPPTPATARGRRRLGLCQNAVRSGRGRDRHAGGQRLATRCSPSSSTSPLAGVRWRARSRQLLDERVLAAGDGRSRRLASRGAQAPALPGRA